MKNICSSLVMAPLLPLTLYQDCHYQSTGTTPKWVTAPDEKPGYILVSINTKPHHRLKSQSERSRVKVEYVLTDFKKNHGTFSFREQYECKK